MKRIPSVNKKNLLGLFILSLGLIQIISVTALSYLEHPYIEDKATRIEYFSDFTKYYTKDPNKRVSQGVAEYTHNIFPPITVDLADYEFYYFENVYWNSKPAINESIYTYRDKKNTEKEFKIELLQYEEYETATNQYEVLKSQEGYGQITYEKYIKNLGTESVCKTRERKNDENTSRYFNCLTVYKNFIIKTDYNGNNIDNIIQKYLIQDVEPLIEALIERIDSFEVVDREITDWHVFSDVQKWSELEEAADYFYRKGTISGYKDGLLKPEELINRAEAAKIFVLATGVTEFEKGFYFKDVPLDSWFQPYASTAKSKKIIWGYNDGNFRPNQPISRVEFLSMASNAFPDLKYYKEDARQFEYDDLVEDEWYNEYAGIGINLGLFEKNENLFKPHKAVTRGEFILNLYRAINGQP